MPQINVVNLSVSPVFNSFLIKLARACAGHLQIKKEISLVLVGDKKIRELNGRYRKKNKITDVLSFGDWSESGFLGEIFICLPQARRQAKSCGLPLKQELARLLLHGLLHLTGYDHEKSRSEAKRMFKKEEHVWKHIGRL